MLGARFVANRPMFVHMDHNPIISRGISNTAIRNPDVNVALDVFTMNNEPMSVSRRCFVAELATSELKHKRWLGT